MPFMAKGGFGGDCIPKDVRALHADLKSRGIDYLLFDSVLADNERIREEANCILCLKGPSTGIRYSQTVLLSW